LNKEKYFSSIKPSQHGAIIVEKMYYMLGSSQSSSTTRFRFFTIASHTTLHTYLKQRRMKMSEGKLLGLPYKKYINLGMYNNFKDKNKPM
jgi:hypothetical protein